MRHSYAFRPLLRRIQATPILSMIVLLAVLSGCGEDSPPPGFLPNTPPDTRIVSGPRDDVPVSYLTEIAWLGNDPDGPVVSYRWRISDNGPDGQLDPADTLGLPWHTTTRTDSIFATSAELDSFPPDVDNPLITDPIDFRNWQTHSFFVSAVDRDGTADPTPARIDFTVTTLLPRVEIDVIQLTRDTCQPTNTTLAFGMKIEDDDDPDGVGQAYRTAMIAVEDLDPAAFEGSGVPVPSAGACLSRAEYEQLDPSLLFPESVWSPWSDYVETDYPEIDLTLADLPPGSSWFLAIQGRDRAGAVTPTFVWNRNFLHFHVDGGFLPTLEVTDPTGVTRSFQGAASPVVDLGFLTDPQVVFSWHASGADYAGLIIGYRWAFDPADPLEVDESEWAVPWIDIVDLSESFPPGAHSVVITTQDNSGQVSTAAYRFEIPAD